MAATDARAAHRVAPYLLRIRGTLQAVGRRLDTAPRRAVLAPLAALQLALVLATAFAVGHVGSMAAVVPQVLLLLPAALVLVYEIGRRLGSGLHAAWTALAWVVLPYAGLLYSNHSFRHAYAHDFLVHVVGLAADARFVAIVAFLAAALFTARAVETGAMLDTVLAVGAAAAGAACAPRAALAAVGPVVALAMARRARLAAAAAVGTIGALAAVGAAVAAGWLTGPFAAFSIGAGADALVSLNESFWSGRVLEWLALAGLIGVIRARPVIGTSIAVVFLAGFFSVSGAPVASSADLNLRLLSTLLPVWGAFALAVASVPLLLPRRRSVATPTAQETLLRLWQFLHRPAFPRDATASADAVATPMWAALAIGCCLALSVFGGIWNAVHYPVILGYDAAEHIAYADNLIHHGTLPSTAVSQADYAPPGYYAVAGAATWVGERLGMAQPHQAAQYLNVVFVLGTAMLLVVLARVLFPRRPVVWIGTVGLFAMLPVVPKTAAMFQPETLNMLLSTAAVTMATWMLVRRRLGLYPLAALGVILAAGQLVRASSLFTLAAIVISLLAALATRSYRAHMPVRAIAISAAALVAVTAPWYARQILTHHNQPGLNASSLSFHSAAGIPASTFFGFSLDDVANRPVRPFFTGQAVAQTYADLWGDWYGAFAWSYYTTGPSPEALVILKDQMVVGVLPTLLAIGGWLAFVWLAVRRRLETVSALPLVLLPVIAVAAYLWRAWVLPAPGSDLLKASYLLTTVPAWAVGFGLAVDLLSRRRLVGLGVAAVLVAFAVLELRFSLYGIREHHPIF